MSTQAQAIAHPLWRVTGSSVRGRSHEVAGTPNQDAIAWNDGDGARHALVLAVSDGHGSPRCFRSDTGAKIAVSLALETLGEFKDGAHLSAAAQALPEEVVRRWKALVYEDIERRPFTQSDRSRFAGDPDDELLAYGATLLAAAVVRDAIAYLQIGDGDIITTDERGTTARVFDKDPAIPLNETHSLCEPDASRELRVKVVPIDSSVPAQILISSDGYLNSFASDADFFLIGRDFRDMIAREGIETVGRQLPGILEETSGKGSQDDITLGIIKRWEPPDGRARIALQEQKTVARPRSWLPVWLVAAFLFGGIAATLLFGSVQKARANSLYERARIQGQSGNYAAALQSYDAAIGLGDTDAPLLRDKAKLMFRIERDRPALARNEGIGSTQLLSAWIATVARDATARAQSKAIDAADLAHLAYVQLIAAQMDAARVSAAQAARLDKRWGGWALQLRYLPSIDAMQMRTLDPDRYLQPEAQV